MRPILLLLVILIIFSGCKKTQVIADIEPSSFRISILPIRTVSLNQYKITGTLEVRNATADISYGVLVGTTIDPTIDNAVKYPIGNAKNSVDFTRDLSDLNPSNFYYVRAYAQIGKFVEYSANQTITKKSP